MMLYDARIDSPRPRSTLPARSYRTIILAGLLTASCAPAAPSGQVLASVDGEEITARDVQAEIASSNAPPGSNTAALTPAALSRIIDRRIVANEGRKLALDKSPTYLAMSQRSNEVLLGETTLERWSQDDGAPAETDVQKFIADNPHRFSGRALIALSQLSTAPNKISMADLRPVKTMAEVEALLQARGVRFDSTRSVADTAKLPKAVNDQLRAAAGGEPLVERQGDRLIITAVGQVSPTPLSDAAIHDFAVDQLKRTALQERIATLRRTAKITVQKGYTAAAPSPH